MYDNHSHEQEAGMRHVRAVGMACVAGALVLLGGCTGGKQGNELTVLIRMMPAQQRFFRDEIVKAFEKEHKCKINIATFNNEWDIERMLKLEAGKNDPEIGLVKTPFEMTRVLVAKGYMQKLADIVDSSQVMQDIAEYHPLATALGMVDEVPYYIPRKLETRILFYRKSKVAEAVAKFPQHRSRINAELKKRNGYGLPKGYALEEQPGEWDFYDLFVVGTIWANEEYNGVKVGRMAHRGARYGGTALFLVDRAIQLGADEDDLMRLTGDKTTEMYLWENMLVQSGTYNPGMWQDPWKGSNIYNGIKDGKVFLAYLQQIDCFLVHGWKEDPGMPTYLPDIDDMGLSVVPRAVSFTMTKGDPSYEGGRRISTGGWWWGVPKTSPDAELAYAFARFVTNKENQARECAKFGMIPVRKDILSNLPEVFDEGWVGDIFEVSIDQIRTQFESEDIVTVPLNKYYSQIAQNMVEAWYKLCVDYNEDEQGTIDLATMKMRLGSDFVPKQKEILGDAYPE
ncbi:MAG: extracellular solute-binding protein [Chitinivibrionales bacterium]|nr:extracellular solute-binding protein [Chitinivibrionales bacterium]MBD3395699.1 extracellular solute-binding protein [Chitinivibrionales bacterium]